MSLLILMPHCIWMDLSYSRNPRAHWVSSQLRYRDVALPSHLYMSVPLVSSALFGTMFSTVSLMLAN